MIMVGRELIMESKRREDWKDNDNFFFFLIRSRDQN